MGATEMILIAAGIVIFLLGYLIPARKKDIDEEVQLISEDEVRKMVSGEMGHVRDRINDIVEETVSYSIEKTERAMERLTNEKIMAINEYSDTVLEEINKNHKEVVFLYDMLNDKHDALMSAINEASKVSDEVKQTLKDAENTVKEATDKADDVLHAVDEASARISDVLRAADEAVKGVWDAQNAAREAREAAQEAIRIASKLSKAAGQTAPVPSGTKTVSVAASEGTRQRVRMPEPDKSTKGREQEISEGVQDKSGRIPAEQQAGRKEAAGQTTGPISASGLKGRTTGMEIPTESEFKPITPKRVEIIHEPEDIPAGVQDEDMSTSAAFASLGIFAPKAEKKPETDRRFGFRKGVDGESAVSMEQSAAGERTRENTPAVDIQFAKNNGRNSNERILELHKAGKSNMAIAKELGLGLGEVKLVIDLFEGM